MPNNLPDSEMLDVREYLYVDEVRVQSLLAQLDDGLTQDRSSSFTRTKRLRLGVKSLGFDRDSGDTQQESMLMADLHVSMLEESADALGMIAEVSDKVTKPKFWKRSAVRDRLQPGSLLRLHAPTQLVSTRSLTKMLRGFQDAFDSDTDEDFDQFLSGMDVLYGKSVSLSIQPTDPPELGCAFVGQISSKSKFPAFEPDLLLSRVGPDLTPLTALVQVARVPTERESAGSIDQQLQPVLEKMEAAMQGESIDRGVLDEFLAKIAQMLEQAGLASAPKWPSISVIPLALYRNIEPAASFDDLGTDD